MTNEKLDGLIVELNAENEELKTKIDETTNSQAQIDKNTALVQALETAKEAEEAPVEEKPAE